MSDGEPRITQDPAEDFRILWSDSAEEIRFFKSQQFSVTNYTLALYAALIVMESNLSRVALSVGLAMIALAVLAIGVWIVMSLQRAMTKSRCRVQRQKSSVA